MLFDIVEIEDLSGPCAKIYSIAFKGDDLTLLDHFIEDNKDYETELEEIIARLHTMGNVTGCKALFFREHEGAAGDGLVALRVRQMRLYCLRYDDTCIFVGSGGYKPPFIRAYQDDKELSEKASQMRKIAASINKAIVSRDIRIDDAGAIELTEDLELTI